MLKKLKTDDLDKSLKEFYDSVAKSRRIDNSFALKDDKDLTKEEIAEIDAFWGRYKFAYPEIDYNSFKTFKNRCGYFDVRHCPGAIRTHYFNKHFSNPYYHTSWQNKGLLPLLFPNVEKPVTVLRRMAGVYYDENYNPISIRESINLLLEKARSGKKLIVKPSNVGGGRGIFFIEKEDTYESIKDAINTVGINAFVVQEFIEQSEFMKQFNPTSVNTIRVTSMIHRGEVHVLAALVRIGKTGNQVDNYSQGGSILGIDIKSGKCNRWALTHDNEKITELPTGLNLDVEDLIIPNFEVVKKTVERMHYYIPYIKLISWDIAMNKDNTPMLIENNFAGMIQIHEAVTGPLFGDFMKDLLDTYLLDKFSVSFNTSEWECEEYHDHIEISSYIGSSKIANVPEMIKGKPVTKVRNGAFANKGTIFEIVIPSKIAKKSNITSQNVMKIKEI